METIKNKVYKLIQKYNTRDPFELANYLKIFILLEDLGHINGFYQSCPKNKIIHLNQSLQESEKSTVCAHELGHALLHSNLNVLFLEKNTFYVKNKYENEANTFAAELLIPDDIIYRYENFTLEQIATAEQINPKLLELKFN